MAVRVRYFAALRERRARDEEEIEVRPGETLGEVYARLFPPGPDGQVLPVAFARNRETASADDPVQDGDEIAFLPPIGGG
jgi:molybdopterin converting factor small subunit